MPGTWGFECCRARFSPAIPFENTHSCQGRAGTRSGPSKAGYRVALLVSHHLDEGFGRPDAHLHAAVVLHDRLISGDPGFVNLRGVLAGMAEYRPALQFLDTGDIDIVGGVERHRLDSVSDLEEIELKFYFCPHPSLDGEQ